MGVNTSEINVILAKTATGDLPLPSKTELILPENLELDTWCRIGERIFEISESSSWWLGDWLIFGQHRYPDRYERAMSETSLDYQTLRNYAWIARRYEPKRRRKSLSFQHHVEVAALPVEEQDHWLDFAEKFRWSRNSLRKQLRASYQDDRKIEKIQDIQLELRVKKKQVERWEEAAKKVGVDLTDWIATTLEQAVGNNTSNPQVSSNAP